MTSPARHVGHGRVSQSVRLLPAAVPRVWHRGVLAWDCQRVFMTTSFPPCHDAGLEPWLAVLRLQAGLPACFMPP